MTCFQHRSISRLENEDIGAKLGGKSISQICAERRKKHFGRRYRREYFILENAFCIISDGKYQPVSGIKNLVKDYTETTYKLDRRYRYFYFYFDSMEDTAPFEKLRELVENIYTNEYLNKITVNWNNEFADADGETGLVKQKDFFSKYINYSKDRVVVFISDAFRYEVAHTLFEKLLADEKCTASLTAMQGVLPSYTPCPVLFIYICHRVFLAFYIFVESLAEGRTAYLLHGGRQYLRGCGGGCRDEYLCFGKTEAHTSRCKIRSGHHQPFHASVIWVI